jgi:hypothetical protein
MQNEFFNYFVILFIIIYNICLEIIGPGLHTIIYDNSFLSFEILARKQWLLIDHGILKIFGLHQKN